MEGAVYILCGVTMFLCGCLLWRGYRRNAIRLLLWSALCFFGLTLENLALFADFILFPSVDLSPLRNAIGLGSALVLLFGLIWESH